MCSKAICTGEEVPEHALEQRAVEVERCFERLAIEEREEMK